MPHPKRDESTGWARCTKCGHRHQPGSECPAAPATGVTWLIRTMPDAQWPLDPLLPRDDSFPWLVRSHCGHPGGAKLWAFYKLDDAQAYEQSFRENPCYFTRCPRSKIENEKRMSRG